MELQIYLIILMQIMKQIVLHVFHMLSCGKTLLRCGKPVEKWRFRMENILKTQGKVCISGISQLKACCCKGLQLFQTMWKYLGKKYF